MRATTLAVLLAICHLVLAVLYANLTPYRTPGVLLGQRDPQTGAPAQTLDVGAPDERQHANYVQNLIDGKGLPVLRPSDPSLYETYESHQPPAYYVLAAGFAQAVGAANVASAYGLRLRYLNALVGSITVLGVYFLASWGFKRSDIALGAATFAAFLPMLCALDGSINNDALLYCSSTWCLAICALGITRGWTWKLGLALGLVTGIAFLTKTTALTLAPTVVGAGFVSGYAGQGKSNVRTFSVLAFSCLLAFLLALPWWIRNNSLYGDPLAMNAFMSGFHNPKTADMIAGLGAGEYWLNWFGWWTIRSFFGAFGYMDIFLNSSSLPRPSERIGDHEILYRLLLVAFIALSAGWLASLNKLEYRALRAIHLLNGIFLALVLLTYVRFNLVYFQSQGRYVIPAIGPIACGLSTGLCFLAKSKTKLAVATFALALVVLNVYVLQRLPEEFSKRSVFGHSRSTSQIDQPARGG